MPLERNSPSVAANFSLETHVILAEGFDGQRKNLCILILLAFDNNPSRRADSVRLNNENSRTLKIPSSECMHIENKIQHQESKGQVFHGIGRCSGQNGLSRKSWPWFLLPVNFPRDIRPVLDLLEIVLPESSPYPGGMLWQMRCMPSMTKPSADKIIGCSKVAFMECRFRVLRHLAAGRLFAAEPGYFIKCGDAGNGHVRYGKRVRKFPQATGVPNPLRAVFGDMSKMRLGWVQKSVDPAPVKTACLGKARGVLPLVQFTPVPLSISPRLSFAPR